MQQEHDQKVEPLQVLTEWVNKTCENNQCVSAQQERDHKGKCQELAKGQVHPVLKFTFDSNMSEDARAQQDCLTVLRIEKQSVVDWEVTDQQVQSSTAEAATEVEDLSKRTEWDG